MRKMIAAIAIVAAGALGTAYLMSDRSGGEPASGTIMVPRLTSLQQDGARLFAENCAACHGENASGSNQGPPLVHKIYEPSHHGDAAFFLAVMRGSRSHHWTFGDMPAQTQVTQDEIPPIIAYVRALQQANGIN